MESTSTPVKGTVICVNNPDLEMMNKLKALGVADSDLRESRKKSELVLTDQSKITKEQLLSQIEYTEDQIVQELTECRTTGSGTAGNAKFGDNTITGYFYNGEGTNVTLSVGTDIWNSSEGCPNSSTACYYISS